MRKGFKADILYTCIAIFNIRIKAEAFSKPKFSEPGYCHNNCWMKGSCFVQLERA